MNSDTKDLFLGIIHAVLPFLLLMSFAMVVLFITDQGEVSIEPEFPIELTIEEILDAWQDEAITHVDTIELLQQYHGINSIKEARTWSPKSVHDRLESR